MTQADFENYLREKFPSFPKCHLCGKVLKTGQGFQMHVYWKHPALFWTVFVGNFGR